jgi:biotin synthase
MTITAAPQTHPKPHLVPQLRWTTDAMVGLFELPFNDLLFRAQEVHRQNPCRQCRAASTLLSIKTGGCSEDCGYCSQSAHHGEAEREALLDVERWSTPRKAAKDKGATRFCMGAAWRGPKDKDLDRVTDMIVRGSRRWAWKPASRWACSRTARPQKLKAAGLDYYNHNLDTAPEFYGQVITTHTQQDRFDTLVRCARPASTSAAAASSAWARRAASAPRCWSPNWPT